MEGESSQQFCLRWHNHQSSVLGGLPALLDSGRLTDVTLCAGGRSLRAHRIVLSTCSPYFMDIFKDLPAAQQPVVVILGGGWAELCCLVAFMYAGEVTLPRTLLPSLLRLASALHITGLTDLNGNVPDIPPEPECDDLFNSKAESTTSTFDATRLSRQNSDSVSSVDNLSLPRPFEAHPRTPDDRPVSDPALELEFLKRLSRQCSENERASTTTFKVHDDEKLHGVVNLSRGKKLAKSTKSNNHNAHHPNESESKNRKIDKIVENLKSNRMKSQASAIPAAGVPQTTIDSRNNFASLDVKLNSAPRVDVSPTGARMETDCLAEDDPVTKYVSHTVNPKLFATCYVCHKRLSNQYNLRVHLETHQNARHACIACSHVSRSRDALRKHVSYRHPQLNTPGAPGRPPAKASRSPVDDPNAAAADKRIDDKSQI